MSVVLAAIVITIFAALFVPPYLFPTHDVFQPSVTAGSPFGFTMHLTLNTTTVDVNGSVLVTGWVNSTSNSLYNLTAADTWGLAQNRLWEKPCTSGWPLGIGLMQGHYTDDNYTLGSLVPLPTPSVECPVQATTPSYFIFEAHSSKALVSPGGTPAIWNIVISFAFRQSASGYTLQPGVYTVVLADEWGDVLTANFFAT